MTFEEVTDILGVGGTLIESATPLHADSCEW